MESTDNRYANKIHNAADIRPCARLINGRWIALSCDLKVATQQILNGDTDTDVQYSPYMDDREDLA